MYIFTTVFTDRLKFLNSKIVECGYGVICRLKKGRVKYEYEGRKYTLKQLWQTYAKKQTLYIPSFQVKAVCLNVRLPKTGEVRLVFVSDGKKQWQALLSTDLELDASQILTYYAKRWSIEVFFKDAKQMLYMGREQSKTFDAAIASYSIVMIRYLLLVYLMNKRTITNTIGTIFRDVVDEQQMLLYSAKIWNGIESIFRKLQRFSVHRRFQKLRATNFNRKILAYS